MKSACIVISFAPQRRREQRTLMVTKLATDAVDAEEKFDGAESVAPAATIKLGKLQLENLAVPIVGLTPLIMHKWSEKAKKQMLDAQQGVKNPRDKRNPEQDYQESMYRTEKGFGFPVLAFKQATVSAARYFGKSVKMTELRQFLFFHGVASLDGTELLVPITGSPRMREDTVKVGMSGTDLRYRGEFSDWSATLHVSYVANALDRESVLSLIDAGGLGVGVGEWRIEKRGSNGSFGVDESREVQILPNGVSPY